jgi:hypothetical protein
MNAGEIVGPEYTPTARLKRLQDIEGFRQFFVGSSHHRYRRQVYCAARIQVYYVALIQVNYAGSLQVHSITLPKIIDDIQQADGTIARRQRNVRLGTLTELPTRKSACDALSERMGEKPSSDLNFAELVERWKVAVLRYHAPNVLISLRSGLRGLSRAADERATGRSPSFAIPVGVKSSARH